MVQVLGGVPSPEVTWWREHTLVDSNFHQEKLKVPLHLPKFYLKFYTLVWRCLSVFSASLFTSVDLVCFVCLDFLDRLAYLVSLSVLSVLSVLYVFSVLSVLLSVFSVLCIFCVLSVFSVLFVCLTVLSVLSVCLSCLACLSLWLVCLPSLHRCLYFSCLSCLSCLSVHSCASFLYRYLRPACLALNGLGHRLRKSPFNGVGIMRGTSALHQQQIPHCCGAIP
jgi:hypothetical protein